MAVAVVVGAAVSAGAVFGGAVFVGAALAAVSFAAVACFVGAFLADPGALAVPVALVGSAFPVDAALAVRRVPVDLRGAALRAPPDSELVTIALPRALRCGRELCDSSRTMIVTQSTRTFLAQSVN
ncbi:hypothetical protein FOH10_29240 [Nocardia otitidiscaviarum]|uniref:Uncharacterized protein n=1 Tax=Nocardia otitidiscaviarum TaxID=1823 RepID=A0A516NTH9_9NOCA|nr:hypothetical protein FOH10_29240 [Nocardia otitidiscaviarum]